MYDKSTFATSLQKVLSQKGITQRELASRLNVTPTTVSRYVTIGPKGRTPNVESLVALSQALSVDLNTLVGVDPPFVERQAPDAKILLDVYEKATPEQRGAIWSMLSAFMLLTPEQKIIIDAFNSQEKTEAV